MLVLKDVVEYIEKEKDIFDTFAQEVANATRINKDIKRAQGDVYIKRVYRSVSQELFKKGNYKATPKEIFFDLLLNGYNTIKSGKEFNLTEDDYQARFNNLNLTTKEEKLAYLASLYTILYDGQYPKTFNQAKFEEFLAENGLLIIKLEKTDLENVLKTQLEVKRDGKKDGDPDSVKRLKYIRSTYHLTGYDLAYKYKKIRDEIDTQEAYHYEKRVYEVLKNNVDYMSIFPKSLANELKKIINRPPVVEMLTNVSNEFATKALIKSLPDELDQVIYKNFKKGVRGDKNNTKFYSDELELIASKILIEKYGYYKIWNVVGQGWASVDTIVDIDPMSNPQYKRVYDADIDVIGGYIRKYNSEYNEVDEDNLINFLFMFVVIHKQNENTLKKLIKETYENFEKMVKNFTNDTEKIMKYYTVKSIKNKRLFKSIMPYISKYFFYENSEYYACQPKEVQKLICENYLNTMVLEKTIHKYVDGIKEIGQELPRDEDGEEVLSLIAELFDFKRS